jgi:hypothetical protein
MFDKFGSKMHLSHSEERTLDEVTVFIGIWNMAGKVCFYSLAFCVQYGC